jgi:hypothetical protein
MTRFTYQHLVELVEGDHELIAKLVEIGVIERGDGDIVRVDVEHVMVARTLIRDLEIEGPAIDVILRLRDELARARRRIAELEKPRG